MSELWFFQNGNDECGPVAADELSYLLSSGTLAAQTMVRCEGEREWRTAQQAGLLESKTVRRKPVAASGPAPFQRASTTNPADSDASQTSEAARPVRPSAPPLPSPNSTVRRNQLVAGGVVAAALLVLLYFFWPNQPSGAGTASDGTGNGSDAADGSNTTSDSAGQADDANAAAAANENSSGTTDANPANIAADAATTSPATDSAAGGTATASGAASGDAPSSEATASATDPADAVSTGTEGERTDQADSALSIGNTQEPAQSQFTIAAPGETTFFGLRGSGRYFAYVVDCSGSMQGPPLDRAREELIKSISRLPSGIEFRIVFFDHLTYEFPGGSQDFATASASSRQRAESWIKGINSGGGTDVKLGMKVVLSSNTKPDTVFLLTDGAFEFDAPQFIKSANTKDARVNTVAFVTQAGEALLKTIAKDNRGDYKFVP